MSRRSWFLGLVLALVMLAAVPGLASGTGPPLPFSAQVTGLTAGGGIISITQAGAAIVIRTEGEVTASTLDCAGDPVCVGAGLNGAALTTSHSSTVKLTPTGPGAFSVNGQLEGTVNIGGVLQGPFEVSITGTASCYPSPSECATFAISVTDKGRWSVPGTQARGTLNLSIAGIVGVGLAGSGTLAGAIHP